MKDIVTSEKRKVHFISLGCPKNLVDSEIMLGSLSQANYEITDNPEDAQTIVVNTCGFIEDAKKESISTIFEMAKMKEDGALKQLVVAGCLTQRYKETLVDELPEADVFVGSGEFQNIVEILEKNRKWIDSLTDRILIYTSLDMNADIKNKIKEIGISEQIMKPIKKKELIRKIIKIIRL